MKNKLLLLLMLIAMPVWAWASAGDAANIELKGAARSDGTLIALLTQKTTVHADATAGAMAEHLVSPKADAPANTCPVGCGMMHCPPPGGSIRCCNLQTYQPC